MDRPFENDRAGADALRLRPATASDVPALAALYAASVRAASGVHYDAGQIEAWASFADEPSFRRFVLGPFTLVAEDENGVAGFAGLAADGHVASLYVHPDRMRQGVASTLLQALVARAEAEGIERLYTEASALSRPVFERFGFRLREVETVERRGATFRRYRMVRDLSA